MKLIRKIEKIFSTNAIDVNLLKLYDNKNGNGMNEFIEDCDVIYELQKLLKRIISHSRVDYRLIINKYILLRNIFDIQGIVYISVNYFSEDETLFEYFCSLVYYEDDVRISNRMSTNMLKLLEKHEYRKDRLGN